MAKAYGRVFSKRRYHNKRVTWVKFRYVYPRSPSKRGKYLEVFYSGEGGSALRGMDMKIEANPTPEQLKWLFLALCIVAGLGHEQILGLLA